MKTKYVRGTAGNSRARKSLGGAKSSANTASCKVSAWRNPKDKPSRVSSAQKPDKADAQRSRYEGPDQDLAAQLER